MGKFVGLIPIQAKSKSEAQAVMASLFKSNSMPDKFGVMTSDKVVSKLSEAFKKKETIK